MSATPRRNMNSHSAYRASLENAGSEYLEAAAQMMRWRVVGEDGAKTPDDPREDSSVPVEPVVTNQSSANNQPAAGEPLKSRRATRRAGSSPLPDLTLSEIGGIHVGIDLSNGLGGWGAPPRRSPAMPKAHCDLIHDLHASGVSDMSELPIPTVSSHGTGQRRPCTPPSREGLRIADLDLDRDEREAAAPDETPAPSSGRHRYAVVELDDDDESTQQLHAVLEHWHDLPRDVRTAILLLIDAAIRHDI